VSSSTTEEVLKLGVTNKVARAGIGWTGNVKVSQSGCSLRRLKQELGFSTKKRGCIPRLIFHLKVHRFE